MRALVFGTCLLVATLSPAFAIAEESTHLDGKDQIVGAVVSASVEGCAYNVLGFLDFSPQNEAELEGQGFVLGSDAGIELDPVAEIFSLGGGLVQLVSRDIDDSKIVLVSAPKVKICRLILLDTPYGEAVRSGLMSYFGENPTWVDIGHELKSDRITNTYSHRVNDNLNLIAVIDSPLGVVDNGVGVQLVVTMSIGLEGANG